MGRIAFTSLVRVGSRARGDASADSDYDVLVVVPDDASLERRRSRLGYEVLRGTGMAVDVLVLYDALFRGQADA